MYLGIDLGTSGIKLVLVDEEQRVVDQETAELSVAHPHPLWSEQAPASWLSATGLALEALGRRQPTAMGAVQGVGLSGQMHGATLIDAADAVLRPAILWNDGRSHAECELLAEREPEFVRTAGNQIMPGFTAPKLAWVREHEPAIFGRVARVLLPKDYLRLALTGEYATDVSDASGTLWLDVEGRGWSPKLLAATDLDERVMPRLYEGSQPTGSLRSEWAVRGGLPAGIPVAAGGGDQAAGAVGAGASESGRGLLALGTSGVLFVAGDRFRPNPSGGVHAFCHALPDRWHQMAVILSAAGSLAWLTRAVGARDEAQLLAELDATPARVPPIFLPYLTGERTPHNDPHAKGVFFGLTPDHERADLARGVLEGVAFALRDGQSALEDAGTRIDSVTVLGGGARSGTWARILASTLGRPLDYAGAAEVGPAFGAARLARLAVGGESVDAVCCAPRIERTVEPDTDLRAELEDRYERYRALYASLAPLFAPNP